jgi:hypothetical protein
MTLHEVVLGKKYMHGLSGLQCSLGFMLLRGVLDKKGRVITKHLRKIPREHLWGYLVWLRENNKCLRPFQPFEKQARLSRVQLIRMVEPRYLYQVKRVSKQIVAEFINHVINTYSPKIDFILDSKESTKFVQAFRKKRERKKTAKTRVGVLSRTAQPNAGQEIIAVDKEEEDDAGVQHVTAKVDEIVFDEDKEDLTLRMKIDMVRGGGRRPRL